MARESGIEYYWSSGPGLPVWLEPAGHYVRQVPLVQKPVLELRSVSCECGDANSSHFELNSHKSVAPWGQRTLGLCWWSYGQFGVQRWPGVSLWVRREELQGNVQSLDHQQRQGGHRERGRQLCASGSPAEFSKQRWIHLQSNVVLFIGKISRHQGRDSPNPSLKQACETPGA